MLACSSHSRIQILCSLATPVFLFCTCGNLSQSFLTVSHQHWMQFSEQGSSAVLCEAMLYFPLSTKNTMLCASQTQVSLFHSHSAGSSQSFSHGGTHPRSKVRAVDPRLPASPPSFFHYTRHRVLLLAFLTLNKTLLWRLLFYAASNISK